MKLAPALFGFLAVAALAAADNKAAILKADRVQPKSLAALLASKASTPRPNLIHIGFQELYRQGHIPGSVYSGPPSTPAGLKALESTANSLSRDQALVIYCGCCPWGDCPNVLPAYKLLRKMGFKKVQVLEMRKNYGSDWAEKGYPDMKGD
jgi:hypothetical protein